MHAAVRIAPPPQLDRAKRGLIELDSRQHVAKRQVRRKKSGARFLGFVFHGVQSPATLENVNSKRACFRPGTQTKCRYPFDHLVSPAPIEGASPNPRKESDGVEGDFPPPTRL